jgi:hypothetical protein
VVAYEEDPELKESLKKPKVVAKETPKKKEFDRS